MRRADFWLTIAVVVAAIAAAVMMFWGYYQNPELLWRGDPSDRSNHFGLGLNLALAVRNLDPGWFWYELEAARLWPPLHGLVLSMVLLIGGLDARLGVVPSLIGWTVTVVLTWVISRQFFRDPIVSVFAASVSIIFAFASPSFRLLATDVMLECLGSALTALAVYLYMRTYTPTPSKTTWRLLAVTLTLLFFEKYNYWGLTFIALALTQVTQNREEWTTYAREWWRRRSAILAVIARDPAVLASLVVLCFILFVYWRGPQPLEVFGRRISVYPPQNPLTIAYAILFVRLTVAWFRYRRSLDTAQGIPGRAILYWHLLPIAVSLLTPGRLSWLLWDVGPMNTFYEAHDPLSGLIEYAHGIGDGFTVTPWAAALAVLLTLVAFVQRHRFAPQYQAIFLLVVVCTVLLILHPNHQGRFLASWAFAIWITAGTGAGLVFQWATRRVNNQRVRAATALCLAGALAGGTVLTKPAWVSAAAIAHQTKGPTEFDLLPAFLPYVVGSSTVAFLPEAHGVTSFLIWNAEMQCRCHIRTDSPGRLNDATHDEVVQRVLDMTRDTDSDVVVGVFFPGNAVPNDWLLEAMNSQDRFHLAARTAVPSHNGEIVVWHAGPKRLVDIVGAVSEIAKDESKWNVARTTEMVETCFASRDYNEGRSAFMEKRNPVFTGT